MLHCYVGVSGKMSSRCIPCDRSFGSQEALEQHLRDSPVHAPSLDCEACDRSFGSQEALEQHLRDPPSHRQNTDCKPCNRSFGSQEALEQHLRDSPAHRQNTDCKPCNRSFGSQGALEQHLRDSPAHHQTTDCKPCNRSFGSRDALEQHLRDSPAHLQHTETPLDAFFYSYPTFDYDPSLPPNDSYAKLQKVMGWRRDHTESTDAWDRYQHALEMELHMWYGPEDDLTAWHALCRAIGIEPLPETCEQCEKAARRTHVNIIDLIECRRGNKGRVRTFPGVEQLRAYTKKTGKIFRIPLAPGGGNIVLRHLLRKIF
ncbi:Zinc finger protein [Colletotrichum tanaceti]|uniref:Zinc finger protein n=1 Tax=Colletotrichum tanaceti TaxID=1306861 RepID=A0A4U6XDQ6_9PEZI|nr:Zinc finger protein [Colletotrichum tanaceti]TKW53503.1 Zinc finger protein [Colletotrichum tanaceti]